MKAARIKALISLTFLVSAIAASADPIQPTVLLLTSIDTPSVWYNPETWNLTGSLEKEFRRAFQNSGYQLVVKHQVNAYELSQVLHDPANVGVFWVSHAASDSSGDPGNSANSAVGRTDVVLDMYGINVKDVFQQLHPNLRWLAVVGCETSSILGGFIQEGLYKSSPHLTIEDYSTTIDANQGLTYALNASAAVLGVNPKTTKGDDFYSDLPRIYGTQDLLQTPLASSCPASNPAISMKITRSIPAASSANALTQAFVYLGDRLLTILPEPKPGDVQTVTVPVPYDVITTQTSGGASLELVVNSGIAGLPATKPIIGDFTFDSVLGGWSLFADASGNAIGVTSHLYIPNGTPPFANSAITSQPILSCQ